MLVGGQAIELWREQLREYLPDADEPVMSRDRRPISSATLVECSLVVEVKRGEAAGRELDLFLHRATVQTVAVDEEQARLRRVAWRRYGRGRHPAGLNFGHLFAYAMAQAAGEELPCKGDDFANTDIVAA